VADVEPVLAAADKGFPASLERMFTLIRFPTVATDPKYHGDCRKAAEWLVGLLRELGFQAETRNTTGQPVVIAKSAAGQSQPHAPHILFYGHYDVQPADPLDLWETPPFEPQIRTGKDGRQRIFARGASDDKGQLLTFLEASRAWLSVHGQLPFRLTVLLEGDEEGDSTHLDRFLKDNAAEFACDSVFICDSGMWDAKTPAIDTMLRGCICDEVTITGPRIDLHSGYYGGPAVNPIKVLAKILGGLHDKNGRVTIKGFYDGVKPPTPAQRQQWARLKFSPKKFLGDVGLKIPAGEKGFSPLEQMWARPTAEVNGIYGGYRGAGSKTVLPSEATGKISFRLVAGQDPKKIRKAFRAHVKALLPKDCKARFQDFGGDSSGITVANDTPYIAAAHAALKAEWGRPAVEVGSGGSIPVVESFRKWLGVDSLLVGFALDDDSVHSPNEKYDVESYRKGIRTWARIIAELSGKV